MAETTDPNAKGALDGIRVLACTQIVAGPFTGVVLSDFGAEVVKLEPPEGEVRAGDAIRIIAPRG